MRVLVVSRHLPYDGVPHAGGAWLLRHLEHLARVHDVTLVVPGTAETKRNRHRAPDTFDIVVTDASTPSVASLRLWWDRLRRRARFSSLHAPVLAGMRAAGLASLAAAADVVDLQWTEAAIVGPELRRAGVRTPIVVVAHDLTAESVPSRRPSRRPPRAWIDRTLDRVRRRVERRDLETADLVLVFKDEDRDLLRRLGVATPSLTIDPFLDEPTGIEVRGEATILFTGAMWRPENQAGVAWFLREVWPTVAAEVPGATFVAAGADPPPWLEALAASVPGATLTGTVPHLGPYYERAFGFVAPLFVAGGLKFKVPQAMRYGLPVVATTTAAAGVAGHAPDDALWAVTDDAATMAAALVDLLRRPADAAGVGERAARWSSTAYDPGGRVAEAYASLARP